MKAAIERHIESATPEDTIGWSIAIVGTVRSAWANGLIDRNGDHIGYVAQLYPHRYAVTKDHIAIAKCQLEQDKQDAIARLTSSSTLLMVGMGGVIETVDPDRINNYRVRGEFFNTQGTRFFLEVGSSSRSINGMRCDFSINRDIEEKADAYRRRTGIPVSQGDYYNWKNLERSGDLGSYTKSRLLYIINSNFDCWFTGVEVDNYTLRVEDYISVSP